MSDIQKLKEEWKAHDDFCLRSLYDSAMGIEQRIFFESERLKDLVRLVFVLADEIDDIKKQIAKPIPETPREPVER